MVLTKLKFHTFISPLLLVSFLSSDSQMTSFRSQKYPELKNWLYLFLAMYFWLLESAEKLNLILTFYRNSNAYFPLTTDSFLAPGSQLHSFFSPSTVRLKSPILYLALDSRNSENDAKKSYYYYKSQYSNSNFSVTTSLIFSIKISVQKLVHFEEFWIWKVIVSFPGVGTLIVRIWHNCFQIGFISIFKLLFLLNYRLDFFLRLLNLLFSIWVGFFTY